MPSRAEAKCDKQVLHRAGLSRLGRNPPRNASWKPIAVKRRPRAPTNLGDPTEGNWKVASTAAHNSRKRKRRHKKRRHKHPVPAAAARHASSDAAAARAEPPGAYTGPSTRSGEAPARSCGFGPKRGEASAMAQLTLQQAVHSLTRPSGVAALTGPAPVNDDGDPIAPGDSYDDDHSGGSTACCAPRSRSSSASH